jgi:hypothetical protein
MRDLGTPLAPTFGGGGKKRKNKCKKTKGKGSSCGIGPSKKQGTVAGDYAKGAGMFTAVTGTIGLVTKLLNKKNN